MTVALKTDIGRILKRKIRIEGDFETVDEGVLLKTNMKMKEGSTGIVSFKQKITFFGGHTAHIAVNPLLYAMGTVTGPTIIYKGASELFFRYEPDEDIDLGELDYVVKLVITKDN